MVEVYNVHFQPSLCTGLMKPYVIFVEVHSNRQPLHCMKCSCRCRKTCYMLKKRDLLLILLYEFKLERTTVRAYHNVVRAWGVDSTSDTVRELARQFNHFRPSTTKRESERKWTTRYFIHWRNIISSNGWTSVMTCLVRHHNEPYSVVLRRMMRSESCAIIASQVGSWTFLKAPNIFRNQKWRHIFFSFFYMVDSTGCCGLKFFPTRETIAFSCTV